jgi:hypothetical protein
VSSQASDIEIYQQAKSGQITLLFMIDVSGVWTKKMEEVLPD